MVERKYGAFRDLYIAVVYSLKKITATVLLLVLKADSGWSRIMHTQMHKTMTGTKAAMLIA